jgi:hypothetical protein
VSKPPLEPNLSRQSSPGQVRGEKRLILKIPDVWKFIPSILGGKDFETTAKDEFRKRVSAFIILSDFSNTPT